ncbi:CAI-1 autoinducer synthase [Nocardia transvalensis]|uniref:8-amino-7-oxononanoate synthase n=1 Tax=Nocardia transvalensis TaxID=37333 RepID=A0A7W9UM60_9NOCA|nr:aminotransferase class I/II-fold pyridoxal phosphate-dependent enzyme [Nocardia transvalensis]MBB5918243.1 CAI-1 autoinducer synthase [Nocardia transvalensis]
MATVAERVQDRIERARVADPPETRPFLRSRPPAAGDVVLSSNDYLALSRDARITAAIAAAVDSAPGDDLHALTDQLTRYLRAGAGIVCQSGWDANIGLLQAISEPGTPVYIDRLAHMSLRQGAVAAGAPVHTFRHNDLDHLRAQIRAHGPGIIAVDAIYSTSGCRSPLPHLCEIAEDTGGLLVVDESHSLGIEGPEGAGVVVALGLADRVPFRTASLAKTFVGRAGVVAARDPAFAGYFESASYPAVFSSGLRSHDIAGLAATLAVVRTEHHRRARLRSIAVTVRKALTALGFDLAGSDSQIVSIPTGTEAHGRAVRDILERHGILGSPFCPPATPPGGALIRLSLHAALEDRQVDRIIQACTEIRATFGVRPPGM